MLDWNPATRLGNQDVDVVKDDPVVCSTMAAKINCCIYYLLFYDFSILFLIFLQFAFLFLFYNFSYLFLLLFLMSFFFYGQLAFYMFLFAVFTIGP